MGYIFSVEPTIGHSLLHERDLRQFWNQPDKKTAEVFLASWIPRVRSSGVRILIQFVNTLSGRKSGLLACYDHQISTGPLEEDTNNKIKTMQKQAYGFRDMEFFKLKIMAIHKKK